MKFLNASACGVVLELDATDCTALADALDQATTADLPGGNLPLLAALGATLRASAIVAAWDTLQDAQVPQAAFLTDVRRVWGPRPTNALTKPASTD